MKIYGKNSVFDAIKYQLPIKKIYLQKGHIIPIDAKKIVIEEVSKFDLDKKIKGNHQGFLAILEDFIYHPLKILWTDLPKKILILDHIQDPYNFGSIIRSCNAAGVNHIIIAKNRQVQITPAVWKAASGGFVNMKIILVTNLAQTIQELKKNRFWIYGATIAGVNFKKVQFNFPLALVIGGESKGISKNLLKQLDQEISIPLFGTVQSLNAAIATAIILFAL